MIASSDSCPRGDVHSRMFELAGWLAVFVLVGSFYVWTTRSNHISWRFGSEQKDYYNLLVHGFLDGQLSLKADVPPELLNCPNPYDPAMRPQGVALHDASLYHGKYYIYYGVVPAVVALLPFRVMAGFDLPVPLAVLIFVLGTYAIALYLMADLRRRFFSRCRLMMSWLLAIGFGFASCAPVLLRRSSMYELPITCGAFFALLGLACLVRVLVSERRRIWWLAASSLAWGLAIGSRPTYILVPACVLVVVLYLHLVPRTPRTDRRTVVRLWLAAGLPIIAVGVLLAAYNYARFGRITEFGVSYILSGVYEAKIEHFKLRYVPWNIGAYFFSTPEWSRTFPFFHEVPITWPRPTQHYGMDVAFGLLTNVPFYWLGVFALSRVWRRGGAVAPALRMIVACVVIVAVAVISIVVLFYAAMARYTGDFAPTLALLGAIGGMTVLDRAVGCRATWRRFLAPAVVAAVILTSVFAIAAFSIQVYGRLRTYNPGSYAALARVLDRPNYWLPGSDAGAVELRVRFPSAPVAGRREELLRTGWGNETDRLSVVYESDSRIGFEFEHRGAPVLRSELVRVDTTAEHVVHITAGSLYPPASWPGYRERDAEQTDRLLHRLIVSLDGKPMLCRRQATYGPVPDSLTVGDKGQAGAFSGQVLAVNREKAATSLDRVAEAIAAEPPELQLPKEGVWRLAVRFAEKPPGTREPLLVTGVTGEGDFVVAEFLEQGRLRLLLDHWGSQSRFSPPISYVPGHEYRIEIAHAAYLRGGVGIGKPSEFSVAIDGVPVWTVAATLYPVSDGDIYVGRNPLGGSSCAESFGGDVAIQRTEAGGN